MQQTRPPQQRSRWVITLLGFLLVCALPMAVAFFVVRSIRNIVFRLPGRHVGDEDAQAAIAQARKRARKAKAAYDAANRRYVRASGKLAKAQAALEALEKPDQQPDSEPAPPSTSSSTARFWFGIGRAIATHLIERQMRKLP
jgi:hypothetical protein